MAVLPPVDPDPDCPKSMTFGPCGGVHADDTCEVDRRPCPFLQRPLKVFGNRSQVSGTSAGSPTPAAAPTTTAAASTTTAATPLRIRFLVDFRPASDWSSRLDSDLADRYRRGGRGAAWLIGEHVDDTHGLGVAEHARRLGDRFGLPLVITVTGRNRTRSQAEGLLDELAELNLAAVHCVTGDHPAARFGPDHHARFGVDSQMLVALAAARGLTVSVAESPASPPVDERAQRVSNKERSGAAVVVVNHAGSADDLRRFSKQVAAIGVSLPLVGPVPLIADRASARRLTQFPGLALDSSLVERVLRSCKPQEEGRRMAVAFGRSLLAPEDEHGRPMAGLNLSGVGPTDARARADFVTDIINDLG